MEPIDQKQKNKKLLKKSFTIWIIGGIMFFIGISGTFSPNSPSPVMFWLLFLISMPISLIGTIMVIVNGIKYLRK